MTELNHSLRFLPFKYVHFYLASFLTQFYSYNFKILASKLQTNKKCVESLYLCRILLAKQLRIYPTFREYKTGNFKYKEVSVMFPKTFWHQDTEIANGSKFRSSGETV